MQDFGRCLAVEPLEARAYELRALSRRKLLDFGGACDDYRCAAAIRSGQLEAYMKAEGCRNFQKLLDMIVKEGTTWTSRPKVCLL